MKNIKAFRHAAMHNLLILSHSHSLTPWYTANKAKAFQQRKQTLEEKNNKMHVTESNATSINNFIRIYIYFRIEREHTLRQSICAVKCAIESLFPLLISIARLYQNIRNVSFTNFMCKFFLCVFRWDSKLKRCMCVAFQHSHSIRHIRWMGYW